MVKKLVESARHTPYLGRRKICQSLSEFVETHYLSNSDRLVEKCGDVSPATKLPDQRERGKASDDRRAIAAFNRWLLKNAVMVDAHGKASTVRLVGRESV